MPEFDRFADDAHRYALTSRIATGGMGEVWRGRDTTLGRDVAIKLLKAEYADDPTFRRRFEGEAQHAASLHHPGIAGVYDFGEGHADDPSGTPRPYLVMELVEGQPLSALLRPAAPLDAEVARDLMAQAAEALGAAHRAGIVHRDVKPGNLIVTPDRLVKVTDFGIARAADGIALTETGQVMGTPAYLSPEQAEGSKATASSDVYSLACVAFECLAGRRPFVADTSVATAVAHLRQPVPKLPDSVPSDLAAVITRALAKDPSARFVDGSAFAAALRSPSSAAAVDPPVSAPLPPSDESTVVLPAVVAQPPSGTEEIAATPAAADARTSVVPWFLLGAVLVASALIIWQILGGAEDDDRPTDTRSANETRTQTESPSESTEPEETVEVDADDYIGRDIKDVQQALKALGLKVSRDKLDNPGDETQNAVAGVDPSGSLVTGDQVTVSYWGQAPKKVETPTTTPSPSETPTTPTTPTPTTPTTPTTSPPATPTETPTDTTAPSESPSQ